MFMDSDQEVVVAAAAFVVLCGSLLLQNRNKKKKSWRRRLWMLSLNRGRARCSTSSEASNGEQSLNGSASVDGVKAHFEPILQQIQLSELQSFKEPLPEQERPSEENESDPLSNIDKRRMTNSNYRYIENLPHFCKENNLWRIDVPKDKDCLYLAIILAYLVPVRDEDPNFKVRFNDLSGKDSYFDEVKTLVRNYNPFLNMRHTYDDKALRSFTEQFRTRVIDYMSKYENEFIDNIKTNSTLRVEDYLSTKSDPIRWGSEFEVMAIRDLLKCSIYALPTGQLGTDELNSSLIKLVYDVNSPGRIHYNFYLNSDIGRYFEVYSRLNVFVKTFVKQFQAKLQDFHNQIKPGGKTKIKKSKVVGGLGQILGGIATYAVGLGFSGTSMGKDAVSYPAEYFGNKKARDLAEKIIYLLQPFQNDKAKFREMLINIGAEIFRNFENQFADCTDRAMDKLAGNGVCRVVNYLDSEFKCGAKIDNYTVITKGIILGKSNESWIYKITRWCEKLRVFWAPKPGHKKKEGERDCKTSDIYEKTGLLIEEENNVINFYKKKDRMTDEYGYRLPFKWELDEKVWLEQNNYELESNASKKYVYVIKLGDELKQRLEDILNEFNRDDLEQIPEKITYLKEGQDRVEKNVERGNENISKLQVAQEMSQKMTEKGLEVATINLGVSQGTLVQIEEVKQKTEELGSLVRTCYVLLQSNLREIHSPINNTELHDGVSSDSQENAKALLTQNVEDLEIFLAAQNGSEQIILDLLNANEEYDINVTTRQGATPLHYAANSGHVEIVKALLNKGALIDVKTDSYTALHLAAQNGHEAVVKVLLNGGAKINETNAQGATALHLAVNNNHTYVVEALMENNSIDVDVKTEQGVTPLYYAVQNDCLDVVKALLKKVDVNGKIKQGRAPLHHAAIRGYEEIIRSLLGSGDVIVDIKDSDGLTPLHYAACSGQVGAAKVLLEKGAAVNGMTAGRNTPLLVAVHYGQKGMVDYLLEKDADPNVIDLDQATSLHYAARGGYREIVKSLLSKEGVEVNILDKNGLTPLHYAAGCGYQEIVRDLLKKMDHVETPVQNLKPIHMAAAFGNKMVIDVLLETDRKGVNVEDEEGATPLHYAARIGRTETVEALFNHGADINAKTINNTTPLQFAESHKHEEAVQILTKAIKGNEQQSSGCCLLHSEVPQNSPDNVSSPTVPGVPVIPYDQLMKGLQALMNEQTAQFSEQLQRVEHACEQLRKENAQLRGRSATGCQSETK